MCNCKNVKFGEHSNTVKLEVPEIYKNKFPNTKYNFIYVDKCISNEIQYLWRKGIVTMASCCGHNIIDGCICVHDDCIEQMKDLGYEVLKNPSYPNEEWMFKSKTCKIK